MARVARNIQGGSSNGDKMRVRKSSTYVVAVMAVAVAGVAAAVAIAVAVHTYTAQQSMARATRNIHGGSSDGDKVRVNNGTSSKKHPRWQQRW